MRILTINKKNLYYRYVHILIITINKYRYVQIFPKNPKNARNRKAWPNSSNSVFKTKIYVLIILEYYHIEA